MKKCAQCHGKLGLGVRSRNLWNGRWWGHVRFCSTLCEARHELERRERQMSLVHTFPLSQHWLDYDVAALAFLIVGIAAVELLAIII
jgi:hypothetical protein